MAKLLQALGRFSAKRAWYVIIAWLLILATTVTWMVLGMGKLSTSMSIKGVAAQKVIDQLQTSFPEAARGNGSVVFHTANGQPFTDEQKSQINADLTALKSLDAVATVVNPFELNTTKSDAATKIADGYQKIADAKVTIATNLQKIADGRTALVSAKKQLQAGQVKLDAAKKQLEASSEQLSAAKKTLDTQEAQLNGAVQAGYKQETDADVIAARQAIAGGRAQYAGGMAQVRAGWKAYYQGVAKEKAGWSAYKSGVAKLKSGAAKLADAKVTLATKETELIAGDQLFQTTKTFGLVSKDGTTAVSSVMFTKPTTDLETSQKMAVVDYIKAHPIAGVETEFSKELTQSLDGLMGLGEILGLVIAGVVLFVMLGTLIGAGLPLLAAILGVGISATITMGLSGIIAMNSTTPVLGVMLGLAIGIDYALFLLNRHRKQLKAGMKIKDSIGLATGTSGNAVVFAGLTVIIALLALNITGIEFLGLMGDMASISILVGILLAITLTPAMMSLLGLRVLSKKERNNIKQSAKDAKKNADKPEKRHALVVRHPWITIIGTVATLAIVAIPFFSMRLGLPDGSSEPTDSTQYKAYTLISKSFGAGTNGQVVTVVTLPNKLETSLDETKFKTDVALRLDELKNVDVAVPAAVSSDGTRYLFQVIPTTGPASVETTNLVNDIRGLSGELKSKYNAEIGVTGLAAMNIDISQRMSEALPIYLTVVILLSILLMILVFRSIAVPVVASAGFLLSVMAGLGSVVAVYQWGWAGWLFDVHDPGPIMNFLPTIAIGILFGLAMDYQLFLATGMREAYVHGMKPKQAITHGLRISRPVVLAAASIMVSVFGSFVFSHSTMIRPVGFALAAGVLFDAFIVRLLLMPALLTVLGRGAWWLPRWLDRILPDVDVEGAKLERKGH